MEKTDKTIYVIILVFALLVFVGFFLLLDKIGNLEMEIKNLTLQFELKNKNEVPISNQTEIIVPPQTSPTTTLPVSNLPSQTGISISTAILFSVSSSPALSPQSLLTLAIESATKKDDGTLKLNIKVFTSNATSYSALDVKNIFELINLEGANQEPNTVTGAFNSMPPKSVSTGIVEFSVSAQKSTFILQIQTGNDLKFYEFNFEKQTYKETEIG